MKSPRTKRTQTPTSVRLSPEGKRLLIALAKHMGLSQTGVIETLVRDKARQEKLS